MTGNWINNVGKKGINLPTFNQSMKIHVPFIEIFLQTFKKVSKKKYMSNNLKVLIVGGDIISRIH